MSNWYGQPDPRIPAEREDDGWRDDERGYIAHEAARVAALCAKAGGHPESAPALERTLLTVAGIEPTRQRNDSQQELFAA